jgi:hypothetical protein
MKRTSDRIIRKTVKLEVTERMVDLREMDGWTFWKVRPPLKRKEKLRTA